MRIPSCLVLTILFGLLGCPSSPPGDPNDDPSNPTSVLPAPNDVAAFALDDTLIPAPALAGVALLNEIRYLTITGESQFVELKGVTTAALADGLSLINELDETYAIPPTVVPADGNGIITVYFDGHGQVAADVVHADRSAFLNTGSGMLRLLDHTNAVLDSVAWGLDRADSIPLGNGGVVDQLLPQSTLGRPPASVTASCPSEWVTYAALLATPAGPNRNLSVTVLLPTHGALVETGQRVLSWYPVSGASQYRVQVESAVAPGSLIVDEVVTEPVYTFTVAAGAYTWRVQALLADGASADFSPTSRFEVVDSYDAFFAGQDVAAAKQLSRRAQQATLSRRVPLYAQRKDTYMLYLKSNAAEGDHAWNQPHPFNDSRFTDPADNGNCSAAAISMVNGYFAEQQGSTPYLSQDRIEVAARTHQPGAGISPNEDLNCGVGLAPAQIVAGMEFALGLTPRLQHIAAHFNFGLREYIDTRFGKLPDYPPEFRELFFADLKTAIDAGRPVLFGVWQPGFDAGHAMVATHYSEIGAERWVGLNDPWYPEFRWQRLNELLVAHYYLVPEGAMTLRADVPDYLSAPSPANGNDDDGDGVSNFDEIIRFGTDPRNRDTDGDCVDDLEEIRLSVFDERHGWGTYHTPLALRRTPTSDGKARGTRQPELTSDLDGGGLPDFVEDIDMDGHIDPLGPETDPFDPADDSRRITGTYRVIRDDPNSGFTNTHLEEQTVVELDLTTTPEGKLTGTAQLTYTYKQTNHFEADSDCPSPRQVIYTRDPVIWTTQIEGRFFCVEHSPNLQNPGLRLITQSPPPSGSFTVYIDDPCLGPDTAIQNGLTNLFSDEPVLGGTVTQQFLDVIFKSDAPIIQGRQPNHRWDLKMTR